MNVLQLSFSSTVFWKELVFIETRVGAVSKTEHLKQIVAAQRAKFDAVWLGERDMEFAVSETQALVKTAESRVYGYMEDAYSAGAHEVKQKRKDARYAKLFSMGLSGFSRLNFVAQKTEILRMKDVLELDIYGDAFRQAQNGVLDQALAEIERVLSLRADLEKRQRFHRQDVERWKNETNQVRMEVYGELVLLSETLGEGWARSFFPLQKKAKKLSTEEKALQEAKRVAKRLKKATEKQEFEKIQLDEANQKVADEKKKKEMEEQMKKEAKARADKREADRLADERRQDELRRSDNGGQPVGDTPVPVPVPVPVLVDSPVPEQV